MKSRKKRQYGGNTLEQIRTGNRNLQVLRMRQMPKDPNKIKPLYKYLLHQNYEVNGLVLSCVKQNIVLSCIMYDLDMNKESGTTSFRNLFLKADQYDQILKSEFGCQDRLEE